MLPWVLLRKGKPLVRFADRELGKRFFDRLRFNAHQPDSALVGPKGEAWYCGGSRWAQWVRDDDERRRRDPPPDDEAAA